MHIQTEHFAKYTNSDNSYFNKLQKSFKSKHAGSLGAGNSIENTHMAQYNEQRIARMLLQEKLTSLELSKKKAPKPRTKTSRRSSK